MEQFQWKKYLQLLFKFWVNRMSLQLARSKKGHDKNQIYVIASEDEDVVYLVNGTTRRIARPKKKKRKHIQPIFHLSSQILSIAEQQPFDDVLVKRIITCYRKETEVKA